MGPRTDWIFQIFCFVRLRVGSVIGMHGFPRIFPLPAQGDPNKMKCSLNDSELAILNSIFQLGKNMEQQIERLAMTFGSRLVALTRGPLGSILFENGKWSHQPPAPVRVVDTVGAGDSFTATLVMGLLADMELDALHAAAAEVAGFVCTQPGATPALPRQIRDKFIHAASRPAEV